MKTESKQFLLKIARKSLENYFRGKGKLKVDESNAPAETNKLGATFVTLTKDGELRGCIGSLIAKKKIYEDVINNSLNAAFSDHRFPQLAESELNEIKIEISVLGEAKHMQIKSPKTFLEEIERNKPGLILQVGMNQATYLPQVWEDLPEPNEFMSTLSQKAGLLADAWARPDAEIFTYNVDDIQE
ncbi:MAG: AmmeMemoRadiSam system protein A [Patescibacteria group bacterium]|jgi:AmmeMemoRadiSam system protein A